MENKKTQYVYECQEKSGLVFTTVLKKKVPTQLVIDYYNSQEKDENKIIVKCVFVKEVEKGKWHWCKHCGELVEGSDEDILCEECCMKFGHYRFSQL